MPSNTFDRTYLKTISREIHGSLGRFIAIFGIVALGVGFLAGLLSTTPDMKLSVDHYFDDSAMMDVFVKGTMGLTEDDRRELEKMSVVEQAMGAYVLDALVTTQVDETLVTRIYGFPLSGLPINKLNILKGRMPAAPNECLAQEGGAYLFAPEVGTRLFVSEETLRYNASLESLKDVFAVTEFTVTGIVQSPLFISQEREPSTAGSGTLDMALFVDQTAYSMAAYTDFFVTLEGAAEREAYSPAYQELVDQGLAAIETFGEGRSLVRQEEIRGDALGIAEEKKNEALDEVEAAYEEGKALAERELAAGRKRLNDAAARIASGAAEIADGRAQLADAEQQIEDGKQQIAAGWEEFYAQKAAAEQELADNEVKLRDGEAQIAAAKQTLAESKAQLDAARDEVEKTRNSRLRMLSARAREGVAQYDAGVAAYNDGVKTVADNEAALKQGREQLAAGRKQAEEGFATGEEELRTHEAEIAAGEEEIAANRQKLADAEAELARGRAELARGEAEYAQERLKAEAELADGAAQIAEARAETIDIDIPLPTWYVFDRKSNVGAAVYGSNAEKINDVAKVFPAFFLLIAVLVALTTMTRMVAEERTQIGTLKALGYGKRVILLKYLVYCSFTGIAGSAAGMVAGFQIIPAAIYRAFGTLYHLPPLITVFNWGFGLIACALVLTCIIGATVYACYHTLWEKPAALMLPAAPKAGKRILLEYITPLWKRMKFTHKVTARNLFRQKRHFFMTITGISGCTALMVAGFGLRDSMVDIARTEFTDILLYDVRIEMNSGIEELENEADGEILHFTEDAPLKKWAAVHSESGYMMKGGERVAAALMIPRGADTLREFVNLRDRSTKEALFFTEDSVVLTEKAANYFSLKAGDTFAIENAAGKRGEFTLTGVTENYVGVYCYIGSAAYHAAFPAANLEFRTILAITDPMDAEAQDEFLAALLSSGDVMMASFTSQTQASYNNLLKSISAVVVILIFASGCLAMLVIYNLTNININERKREIAALRVLGFRQSEAAAYIFREITVLSIIGALAGLILGIPLHRFLISVAENADLMFGRSISLMSFILSALFTLAFSGGVDLLMLPKLRGIKMAESMKAVD